MNALLKTGIAAACLCASAAYAADFEDYARVVSVQPQVEQFNQPRQECRTDYVQVQSQQRSAGGSIIGGIAGGILGNQVGGGNGRAVATAAGAIVGTLVGNNLDNRNSTVTTQEQPVQRCRTIDHWESRTVGYNVTYDYRGHTYTTVTSYDPGDRLRLQVSLTPH